MSPANHVVLLENMEMRDLFVYTQLHDFTVLYYGDSDGVEADAIVEKRSGDSVPIEIKLNPDGVGEPKALIVIAGTGHHYQTTDGLSVVPIGALTV